MPLIGFKEKGREAARPRPPDGERVYAVGDLHGRVDLLDAMHRLILADAAARPAARSTVVYLGDYVDRGLDSPAVIDRLIDRPLAGFASIHLLGNHEDTMLRFHDGELAVAASWLHYGGQETLRSYGIEISRTVSLETLRQRLVHALPARHLDFLRGLRLQHRAGDYLFVHAGIRPGLALERQRRDDLLWIREPFLGSQADHGVTVVHGHTISAEPERHGQRIGIDTGAYATGRLTALVVEGEEQRFLQT
ncbi:MAG: metallophosphoesterase [Dongiaceae bacterium]